MLVSDIVQQYNLSCSASTSTLTGEDNATVSKLSTSTENVIRQAELKKLKAESKNLKSSEKSCMEMYSVMPLKYEVVCTETGLPNKQTFLVVVNYVRRFSNGITYFYNWKVDRILSEDQFFITLMTLRQNYSNSYLAEVFTAALLPLAI